jgi:hypothetical protein
MVRHASKRTSFELGWSFADPGKCEEAGFNILAPADDRLGNAGRVALLGRLGMLCLVLCHVFLNLLSTRRSRPSGQASPFIGFQFIEDSTTKRLLVKAQRCLILDGLSQDDDQIIACFGHRCGFKARLP